MSKIKGKDVYSLCMDNILIKSNNCINEKLEIVIMLVMGVIYYGFIGQENIVLEADSYRYLHADPVDVIMPIYPIILYCIRQIVGKEMLLSVIVLVQVVFAITITMWFSLYIQKRYTLSNIEGIVIFIICMMPFGIELPDKVITHTVMTEGLAYSLFYLYIGLILNYMDRKNIKSWLELSLCTIVLGLLRSQLILLVFFTAYITLCMLLKIDKFKKNIVRNVCVCGLIAIIEIIVIFGGFNIYKTVIRNRICNNDVYTVATIENLDVSGFFSKKVYAIGQFDALIKIKAYYEADIEDVELFTDDNQRDLFLNIYERLDDKKYLYKYARHDLYMWKDLTKDYIPSEIQSVYYDYMIHNSEVMQFDESILTEMAIVLFKRHIGRIFYHSFRIAIMSLIASVFFQIESVYLLCHVIAFSLYITYVVVMIKNRNNMKLYSFSKLVLGVILFMVIGTNILFKGIQRYVVYGMGLFYISMFLNIRMLFVKKE